MQAPKYPDFQSIPLESSNRKAKQSSRPGKTISPSPMSVNCVELEADISKGTRILMGTSSPVATLTMTFSPKMEDEMKTQKIRVVEEGEDEEGARHLEAREPNRREEEDDERDGQHVVQDPALGQQPAQDDGAAHGREHEDEHGDGAEPGDVHLVGEAVVGVLVRIGVQQGAEGQGRDEAEQDGDEHRHGRHEVEDEHERAAVCSCISPASATSS
eukprot:CAMPEP_0206251170 /NCGR_PEP_ID=MMETSP0047_2-20121206/21878_1 /ASSEMBLY_ACC=CAM_ASM_000192 /TAXON_ID=195065 /ORGANISM="Chroomonas mesostigmatica_cf, Strain CCMP1168" /LENGTH=214 /DNA_ID=CAMNT_0053677099 /DNA_START=115 /DNA_END=760 /DNA_ORIENTATION=-